MNTDILDSKKALSDASQLKIALVTGASSGIGLVISKKLIANGICVYGIGRTFNDIPDNPLFIPIVCDVLKTGELTELIRKLKKEICFSIVIHNAGVGYFGPHEELNPKKIHELSCVNLEVPMLLTNLMLRDLKKAHGTIIFISSVTAQKSNTYGCAYGATKAGLSSFAKSLFDEVRKYNVKVATIHPDMTQSEFYRNANFTASPDLSASLLPEDVAEAVMTILNSRDGLVIRELTLMPQLHRIEKK